MVDTHVLHVSSASECGPFAEIGTTQPVGTTVHTVASTELFTEEELVWTSCAQCSAVMVMNLVYCLGGINAG
jgi:hypothetical protein